MRIIEEYQNLPDEGVSQENHELKNKIVEMEKEIFKKNK
jgi:hypothetical protein